MLLIVSFQFLKWSKRSLPHVARLCLVGTYIDDGIRMWFDWSAQSQYMEYYWKCGSFLANLFVIVNLLGQLIGASLVIAQKYATTACGILLSITLLQVNSRFPCFDFLCWSVLFNAIMRLTFVPSTVKRLPTNMCYVSSFM